LVRLVRRDGQIRESELVLPQGRGRALHVAARVAPLGSRLILVLVEDRTRERRVEAIRRDFVANVSHELKTPVGALTLLAEAVAEAADDPEAVQRFSARMQTESERLTRLVKQIIELSRLQGDDPLEETEPIAVDAVVERALDRIRVDASTKGVELDFVGDHGLQVSGNADQLIVALGNLVENAVVYSPEGTSVSVSMQERDEQVEIAVTDHGVGIPAEEIERIFERFYRVDPARARATGGTGLGLSIVKHVAATHGGEVRVWSVEGEGSTFTLCLPAFHRPEGEERVASARRAPQPDSTPSTPATPVAQHQEAL
jgi:two-component system sensor histidine kinase SenX3